MRKEYPALGETLFQTTLKNGLTVAVVPRPGFQRKLAYFVTDFGSIHTDFSLEGKRYQVPAGIAHFLEHKMFELPNRDVMAEFAALGANVNAFTSYDMTAYYFSCTEHFEESLRLLVEFVSTPYFEEDSVQREMGIIDQEIHMNADSPDTRVFENLMEAMYAVHPIRVPILGNCESIREITPETLSLCHKAFYTPGNMILCVIGDVEPESVCRIAEEILGDTPRPVGQKHRAWQESMAVNDAPQLKMEVSMPMFQMGFACEPVSSGEAAIRQEIVGDLAAEMLFGESSELYLELYEKGLIDTSFGGGFESIDGCALLTCSGDSEDAPAIRDAILEQAEKLVDAGISQEDFLRVKRSALGRRIRSLDSFDATCYRICAYHFSGFDYFRFPAVYRDIRAEDVRRFLETSIAQERMSLAVIYPNKEEES